MHHIPETVDIEEATKACDTLITYMRTYHIQHEQVVNAIGILCAYVTRTKRDVRWIESVVAAFNERNNIRPS
jgi:hypothetical protein